MRGLFTTGKAAIAIVGCSVLLGGCFVSNFFYSNVPFDAGPTTDPTITETFRIGPFNLAAINTPGWEVIGNRTMPRPAGNIAIKKTDFTVVTGDGTPVPLSLVHLHHIVLMNQGDPDPLCPSVGARFTGTGGERTRLDLIGDYAYRADAGDVWGSTFHIHTTTATPAPDTYIEYSVTYEPITSANVGDFRFTTPYFFDVTGCWENSQSLYDVPGGGGVGSKHTLTKTYTAARDGVAVFAGGHIHAGSFDISLTRNATGENYCTSTAKYGPGGHPSHPNFGQLQKISPCRMHSDVNAGETFTLRSRYDNEIPVAKAMGIMLVHIWEP